MFNVVTIARECGSGGTEIGRLVAKTLGWELLDRKIIERVAAMGNVDCNWAEEMDEQSCAWWERVLDGFRHGGPEVYVGGVADEGVDRDELQRFTARVIEEAARMGNCVIIGRGSQCVLRNESQALHVLVYAPLAEKLERMKYQYPRERDFEKLLRDMDAGRVHYVKHYFGSDSKDPKLYHLCLNSTLGLDACAELIVEIVRSYARERRVA
ncbi:MAG: hypothetical protein CXZ00_13900 [Acidobacteria bacterium]|nr:MAG: hypothetical protein CXZ00_13900 [Acidobacteriota bacterium]